MSSQVSLNVRFLLWRKEIPRPEWTVWLSQRTALPREVIWSVISGDVDDSKLTEAELGELARGLGLEDVEALRFSALPQEHTNVLLENLRYLFGSLEHGRKKSLAK